VFVSVLVVADYQFISV